MTDDRINTASIAPASARAALGNGTLALCVPPFNVAGAPKSNSISVDLLRRTLCDAFSQMDLVEVRQEGAGPSSGGGGGESASTPAMQAECYFSGAVMYREDGTAYLRFRLIENSENVVWSWDCGPVSPSDSHAVTAAYIARKALTTLIQPLGIIYAYKRIGRHGKVAVDSYLCDILDAAEVLRSFNRKKLLHAKSELEHLTTIDPDFSAGFTHLAAIYLQDYQYGFSAHVNDVQLLESALVAARRGVELSPLSPSAHETLFAVLFARRELGEAFLVGDRAVKLNKSDMRSVATYGAHLIASGEINEGSAMLRRAAESGIVLTAFEKFTLFIAGYLNGHMIRAMLDAGPMANDDFQLGHLVRALIAFAKRDGTGARNSLLQLAALNPGWRDNVRGSLQKFLYARFILDRLTADIGSASQATDRGNQLWETRSGISACD